MSVTKSKDGRWEVFASYKDPLSGKYKQKHKRGFATKREARAWEQSFLASHKGSGETTLSMFYEEYREYIKSRVRKTTMGTKTNIVEKHILPYFGDKKLNEIDGRLIVKWQNMLLDDKANGGFGYKASYVKTIQAQLSTLFNYAVRVGYIQQNPIKSVGLVKKNEEREMEFWTIDEFNKFQKEVMDKPLSHAIFMLMFFTGIREGEALALTPKDIVLDEASGRTYVSITKNWQRVDGVWQNTPPKTARSTRKVAMGDFLRDEILEYIKLFKIGDNDRLFPVTKSYLYNEIKRGSEAAGVKKIRVHDLRHSFATMLLGKGMNVVDVAHALGHKESEVTFLYAHLLPESDDKIVATINELGKDYV